MRIRVLVVAAALLAGCGSDQGSASKRPEAELLERVSAELDAARTLAGRIELSGADGGEALEMRGTLRGTTDGRRSEIRADLTTGGRTVPMVSRQFGTVQFVRTPDVPQIERGKRWLRSEDASPTSALPLSTLIDAIPDNPEIVLRGEEEVQGTTTRHYGGPFDLAAFTRGAGAPMPAGAEVRLDVWIAEDDLPRRLDVVIGPLRTRLEIEEYGVPFDLRRPARRTVLDAKALPGSG